MTLGDAFRDEIPPSLVKLSKVQKELTAAIVLSTATTTAAIKDYEDLLEGNALPAPQEYANRLNVLEPIVAKASSNLEKTIRARTELLAQLQSLVDSNQTMLKEEQTKLSDLKTKMARVLETKIEINDMLIEEGQTQERSTTPPIPTGDGFGNNESSVGAAPSQAREEYNPKPFTATEMQAPAYSPISSDDSDSDEEPQAKKPKVDNPAADSATTETKVSEAPAETEQPAAAGSTSGAAPTGLEGLDPKVAQFLSSLVGSSASP